MTDLCEERWAQSFHLCPIAIKESLLHALARHEHYLLCRVRIQKHMTVLGVECGVGKPARKPAREITTFTGCNEVGLNNKIEQ